VIQFNGMVDRVYHGVGGESVSLISPEARYVVGAEGFPDVVVWNPGEAAAAKLKDLEPGGYKKFVCVEAVAATPIQLQPSEEWVGIQRISVS
jgi:glucose-6-phosphate 1-epimerase